MTTADDQKLKSYFLGELAAADAERLEEDCAADAELTEHAQIVESELADQYLRGVLSAAERRLFEGNYLITEARREKLRSAEMLWKIAAESQTPIETAPTFWQKFFADYRILTFGGLTAAIIFGVFGLFWLNSNKSSEIAKQINTNRIANFNVPNQTVATTPNANAVSENFNINSTEYNSRKSNINTAPKPIAAPEIKPTPKAIAPSAPTLATFVLSLGTLRSEGEQYIKIAPHTDKINLRLTLPKDAAKYQTYRATLKTADGETVFTAPNLKSPNIFLPARKLENQTYLVLLEGQTSPDQPAESVAEYTFRVRR